MTIQLYNTLSRTKEPLNTLEPGIVKMYVCGPTVYNKAHIGHAMSAVVFDIIRRYLSYRGYDVRFAMNFTDVDDKIIRRANEMGVDPFQLAEGYIQDFQANLAALNVLPATYNPRATEEIGQIIAMVQALVEKGFAYPLEGDVYFRVRQREDYGKLSGRRLDDMRVGVRKEADDRKEDPMDFALWKGAKEGEPAWESPWGMGRPGWHIECSAMNYHIFGDSIDIHGGGNDLIFPHHENEIAQSESFTGKKFATYWIHNGMLQLKGEKMSKSIGNIISIDELLTNHSADSFRYLILNSGYRNPVIFNEEVLNQAEKAIDRLRNALKPAPAAAGGASVETVALLAKQVAATRAGFTASMDDDFNSAGALASLYELVRSMNAAKDAGATNAELDEACTALRELTSVFGLTLEEGDSDQSGSADPFVQLLVDVRLALRAEKNWKMSDLIRDRLKENGVLLEDSKDGTAWRWA